MVNRNVLIFGVILLTLWAYHRTSEKPYPPGTVRSEPVQESTEAPAFEFKKYHVQPVADFKVKALVLSADRYFWGRETDLVPVDLALGWGPMSDESVLKRLTISQGNRWYFYHYQELPIPDNEIIAHSGNMHLIPATDEIAGKIKHVRKHDIVEFDGYLVNVTADDGWRWNSSQSRTDTGAGSCEVVWVKDFEIVTP